MQTQESLRREAVDLYDCPQPVTADATLKNAVAWLPPRKVWRSRAASTSSISAAVPTVVAVVREKSSPV